MAVVIRALAVRRLETRPSLRGVWLQMALFLAGLWSAAAIAGPRSPALAGTLQLVVVCGLLLAVNRRVLQRLARRTDIDGGTEAASVGRTI